MWASQCVLQEKQVALTTSLHYSETLLCLVSKAQLESPKGALGNSVAGFRLIKGLLHKKQPFGFERPLSSG